MSQVDRLDTFSHRLRNARMLQGWTQKDLAVASNLSQSAIGNYESGQRLQPSSDALIKLTRALRVNPMWLSTGEGPMLNPGYAEPATNAAIAKRMCLLAMLDKTFSGCGQPAIVAAAGPPGERLSRM